MKKLCLILLIFFTKTNSTPQQRLAHLNSSSSDNSACPTRTKNPLTLEKLYDFKKKTDTKEITRLQQNLSRLNQQRMQNQIAGASIAILATVALCYLGSLI